MTLTGKIHRIFDTLQISDTFKKREFVIEVAENPQYPELIKLEMIQDNCDNLDGYKIGDMVEADINIKGRAWTGGDGVEKFFSTLQAWRLRKQGAAPSQHIHTNEEEEDGLPF